MIIVSQDKEGIVKRIINFDQFGVLGLDEYEPTSITVENVIEIGKYKTEERAKEVLQEIIERYVNWENLKAGKITGICSPKYEMPKK